MNSATAAGAGTGAALLGLIMLMYQIGRWRGGDPTPQIHFFAGLVIAALLMLGGGILGTMGGTAAALGDSLGDYALAAGTSASSAHPAPTGGEKVGLGGVILGLCLVGLYAGLIKSGRRDVTSAVVRGGLCGVWLGASAGLVGMALGLIQTSGTTVGNLLVNAV